MKRLRRTHVELEWCVTVRLNAWGKPAEEGETYHGVRDYWFPLDQEFVARAFAAPYGGRVVRRMNDG